MPSRRFDFDTINPYHLTFADYRNRPEIKVLATDIIGWLHRLTSFIEKGYLARTKRFTPAYDAVTTNKVIDKQWARLVQYDLPYVRGYYTESDAIREAMKMEATVKALKTCTAHLTAEFGDPKIKAKDKTFTLEQGTHAIKGFKALFHYRDNLYIRAFLNTIERFLFIKEANDVCKIIDGIDSYIEIMDSLASKEAMGVLSPAVAEIMGNSEYLTKGYPCDLLCIDKRNIEDQKITVEAIYSHRDRLSTISSTTSKPREMPAEYVILFERNARKANKTPFSKTA
jgi:hypothetical protein